MNEVETNEQFINGGLIGIGEKVTDLLFGEDVGLLLLTQHDPMTTNVQTNFEYNQGAQYETRNWCTIYSAFTELSFLMQRWFTLDDIMTVGHKMIKEGKLNPDKGAYLSDAIDYVRNWYNSNHTDKVASYQVDYKDPYLWDILINKVLRLTQLGYRTSIELITELEDTGHASKNVYPKTYGHAVSTYGLSIIDNYKGKKKNNRYSFDNIQALIDSGIIYRTGYIFLKV